MITLKNQGVCSNTSLCRRIDFSNEVKLVPELNGLEFIINLIMIIQFLTEGDVLCK